MSTSELGIQILFLKHCKEDLAFRQDSSHSGVDIFSSFLLHFIDQGNKGTLFRCSDAKAFTESTFKTDKCRIYLQDRQNKLFPYCTSPSMGNRILFEKTVKILTQYQEFKHSARYFHRVIIL